ncbi:hemolysin family protein [Liquorilactobacillus uvarum]|uniref:hemolysin family protein n=1 Tax=Liquorilactobacillus uvarum TaxID=303240 RepID=UPI002889DCD0|nr:hemolysin family protein [Liquorilactobacillus uvarum]
MSLDSDAAGWLILILIVLVSAVLYVLSSSVTAFSLLKTSNEIKKEAPERFERFAKYFSAIKLAILFFVIMDVGIVTLGCLNLYSMRLDGIIYFVVINYFMACGLYLLVHILPQKIIGEFPSKFFQRTYRITVIFGGIFYPLALVLSKINLKLMAKTKETGMLTKASWETIIDMIKHEKENGELNNEAFEMIEGVISMHGKMAREVMVARTDAFMIDIQNDNDRNIDAILQMPYSRVPVYNEDKDNILGVVHIKNVLRTARKEGFEHVTIRRVMQPALFIPETMTIDEVMFEMKKTQNQMAILFDEYGGVVGLVTLEDLLEEIVGEIDDESDQPDQIYHKISDNEFIVQGRLSLDDFNSEFGTTLVVNEVDTIAGYIITKLGFIPNDGEKVKVETDEHVILLTEVIDDSRITKVRVTLPAPLVMEHVRKEKNMREFDK